MLDFCPSVYRHVFVLFKYTLLYSRFYCLKLHVHVLLLAFLLFFIFWFGWLYWLFLFFPSFVLIFYNTLVSLHNVFKFALLNKWYGMKKEWPGFTKALLGNVLMIKTCKMLLQSNDKVFFLGRQINSM